MDRHGERLGRARRQRHPRPVQRDVCAVVAVAAERLDLLGKEAAQISAGPACFGEQGVRPSEGSHTALDGRDEMRRIVGTGQADDRLHDRKRVLGAMVYLACQRRLPSLRLAPLGDVLNGGDDARCASPLSARH